MKKYDVVIIGGGPSGIITGVTGIKQNPDKSFLLINESEKGLVPCGIPYVFHDLDGVTENQMGPKPFKNAGGEVLIDKVTSVDPSEKILETQDGEEIQYERLVFATGSRPTKPTFIEGYDLEGVEYIDKNYDYIDELHSQTKELDEIVIIGGGFIGLEVAEQLAKFEDKKITIIEMEDHCLYNAFSPDFAEQATEAIQDAGVNILTGSKAKKITGENGQANGVKLSNGDTVPADLIISAIGYTPNSEIAQEAGLEINKHGAIKVDNYLRTSEQDIFAAGDCAGTTGFITGRTDNIMLASTATAEARVLGYNLCDIKLMRNFPGTLSVFSTEINNQAFASAGAIEQEAEEAKVAFVTGEFSTKDRHPGAIKDASTVTAKLTVSPENGEIIGGELHGGKSVGEMINIISLAIQKAVTVYELVSFQIGTHPLLTPAPTKYILIKAAEDAISKIKKNEN